MGGLIVHPSSERCSPKWLKAGFHSSAKGGGNLAAMLFATGGTISRTNVGRGHHLIRIGTSRNRCWLKLAFRSEAGWCRRYPIAASSRWDEMTYKEGEIVPPFATSQPTE
jgi:hypothetical protein